MPNIKPISDLRNYSDVLHDVAVGAPVFLTKNGFGDMVVLSMEAYENLQFESEVYFKLKEAEKEAEINSMRYSARDVLKALKNQSGESPNV